MFIDIDKKVALRLKAPEDSRLATYGRISRDDFKKIINKKDLFLICAAFAGGLTAESAIVGISLPAGEIADVGNKFIPKLVIGGIDAIVKKEIQIGSTTARMGREMKDVDRLRLESSIAHDSHRALRMLTGCGDDVLPGGFDPDCTVDAKGFACAKLSQISIDADGLKDLVEKTLGKLVVPNYKEGGLDPGFFDEIAQPLLVLDDRLPGISDLAGKRCASDLGVCILSPSLISLFVLSFQGVHIGCCRTSSEGRNNSPYRSEGYLFVQKYSFILHEIFCK